MTTKITTEAEYRQVQADVETYLQKATKGGDFKWGVLTELKEEKRSITTWFPLSYNVSR